MADNEIRSTKAEGEIVNLPPSVLFAMKNNVQINCPSCSNRLYVTFYESSSDDDWIGKCLRKDAKGCGHMIFLTDSHKTALISLTCIL
jgi:hypothetical protein